VSEILIDCKEIREFEGIIFNRAEYHLKVP